MDLHVREFPLGGAGIPEAPAVASAPVQRGDGAACLIGSPSCRPWLAAALFVDPEGAAATGRSVQNAKETEIAD